jgi:DNA adenine methylase
MNDIGQLPKIVNVASVPQRSPFRYPGGKTWLVPYLRAWLRSRRIRPTRFIEPFVGGGIISLTVAFERLAELVEMVELDEDVAAVWESIISGDIDWLLYRIRNFEVTVENVRAELQIPCDSMRQQAFNTILRNRTFHGGILAHGSGLLKNGENGKGIRSRWYPETLCQRITAIGEVRRRIKFTKGDGLIYLKDSLEDPSAVFFIDPPYTAGGKGKRAGRRLYTHNDLDHEKLFDLAHKIKGDFLMTYDNDPEVLEMALFRNFDTQVVPMKNTHNTEMVELLIGQDLSWARALLEKKQGRSLFDAN